jgi:hypothetical protein
MQTTDDILALLKAHEGNAWTPDPPATEEQVAEAEKSVGVRLVADYRRLLLASDGGRLSGGNAWINFYPVRDLPEFSDGSYFPDLLGVLVFGGDEGDFIYYFDPEGRYGKGPWAVFMVEKGSADRESSRYLAPDLRRFVDRILAGDSFFDEPFLG